MYSWQKQDIPLGELHAMLEARRLELLQKLPMEADMNPDELDEDMVSEWVLLLEKRDEVVQQKINQENKVLLQAHLFKLNSLLDHIGQFDHSTTPESLKSSLFSLHSELQNYFSAMKPDDSSEMSDMSRHLDLSGMNLDPLSCEPSLLHDLNELSISMISSESLESSGEIFYSFSEGRETAVPSSEHLEQPSTKVTSETLYYTPSKPELENKEDLFAGQACDENTKNIKAMSTSFPKKKSTRNAPDISQFSPHKFCMGSLPRKSMSKTSTPCDPMSSTDMHKRLLKSRQTLRHTPGLQRSPGRTPKRKKRSLNLTDPGDLLAHALRRKFKNVRKLYGSPSADSPGSKENSWNISLD